MKLRVATVPYLNIEPFLRALCHLHACEVIRATPSQLETIWAAEDLDLCLLSVAATEARRTEPLRGATIACDGKVGSVLLIANSPPRAWRRVALDDASVTSNQLARVLIERGWLASPRYAVVGDPAAALREGRSDAALLIGDRALAAPAAPVVIDLGAAWKRWTGLPFVFAAWVRGRSLRYSRANLEQAIHEARLSSPHFIGAAASEHSLRTGLPAAPLLSYLREHISYSFGPREELGRRCFLELTPPWFFETADLVPATPGACA